MLNTSKKQIDIWYWYIENEDISNYDNILNINEKKVYSRLIDIKAKKTFYFTRYLVRTLLSFYLGQNTPKELVFNNNYFGKPHLEQDPTFNFNISHSGSLILLAISKGKFIGIDLEIKNDHVIELIENYRNTVFNLNELAEIASSNDMYCKIHTILKYWTIKESYLKSIGIGLVNDLLNVNINYSKNTVQYFDYPMLFFYKICINSDYVSHCVSDIYKPYFNLFNFSRELTRVHSIINTTREG